MTAVGRWLGFGGDSVAPAEDEEGLVSMRRIRGMFGMEDAGEASQPSSRESVLAMLGFQQPKEFCGFSLTWKQRLYGCLITFGIGLVLTLLSVLALFMFNFVGFGILYSFGSVCSLLCTGFLVGPMTQLRWMFKERRVLATLAYVGMIILTFVVAFVLSNFILVLLCVILQFCALAWYIYTYIVPF
eukprot:Unigene11287_Nuclearia_a/m.34481 Unigene11287_Nuclearia_a/g.34481  ORF Unigene11287_Nuclearia_a/g.34481 Unigene11287_Nuclearia_a/m.34481 type:complete len:186 (-) Unigene11287_Nuclearia_a:226-783(-)